MVKGLSVLAIRDGTVLHRKGHGLKGGLTPTMGIGELNGGHFRNKQEVGRPEVDRW